MYCSRILKLLIKPDAWNFRIIFFQHTCLTVDWASLVTQVVENLPAVQETWVWSLGWEYPRRRAWQPTPVFLPGEFQGQRSLVGYSPWLCKELDTTGWLTFCLIVFCMNLLAFQNFLFSFLQSFWTLTSCFLEHFHALSLCMNQDCQEKYQ